MLSLFLRFTAVTIEFALLDMLCGKGLLVALWYSNVEGFAFHCFARLLARHNRQYFLPHDIYTERVCVYINLIEGSLPRKQSCNQTLQR